MLNTSVRKSYSHSYPNRTSLVERTDRNSFTPLSQKWFSRSLFSRNKLLLAVFAFYALYRMLFKSDEKCKIYGKILLSSLRKVCPSLNWFSWNSKFLIGIILRCVLPNITQIGGEIWKVRAEMYLYLCHVTQWADVKKRTLARHLGVNKFTVAPCINNIKYFIVQLMQTNYKIVRLLKYRQSGRRRSAKCQFLRIEWCHVVSATDPHDR